MPDPHAEDVLGYHERTKHHVERYARSLGYMDWDNQPQPFRFYEGVPAVPLPLLKKDPAAGYTGLFETAQPAQPFSLPRVAGFLELSMGLSAWKAGGGARWPLRINPSSGNLHPTEAHLILPALPGCEAGVFHYDPLHHALERRAVVPAALWRRIEAHFGAAGFFVGLTSIFWREAWKYGERAFRYCNHDVGHALAALRFSANLIGWRLTGLGELADGEVEAILGLNRTQFPPLDEEHPDLLCFVHPIDKTLPHTGLPAELIAAFAGLDIEGRPNGLSREHVNWEIIYRTAERGRKPATAPQPGLPARPWSAPNAPGLPAAEIIRRRRSATAFDRSGKMARGDFLAVLDKTLPRGNAAPFDVGLPPPALHLAIFVHRVEGLAQGLYFLCRNEEDLPDLKGSTRPEFLWEAVEPGFPLALLSRGDFRSTATRVSCHQEIAGESAFSLGMLARFEARVQRQAHAYRELFWESGMIGQVLYLAAEACGLRGTGIGCFFDDAMHELLGLETQRFQSLYHFTVGLPIEDHRLATHPPYAHLKDR
jgi:SagB-type dehydrogenase family enzyme